jgi:hypothetical protein
MKKTRIVTHNGKAHRDEYLACCAIMFSEYRRGRLCFVERRMVSDSDLGCKGTWVVDTGNRWEPDLNNFDHHQPDPNLEGLCAFDLVMMKLLGEHAYESYRAVNPWMKLMAVHDTLGASEAATSSGMPLRSYLATRSPIEKMALARFGETQVLHVDSPQAICMRETGRMLICEAEEVATAGPDLIASAPPPFEHAGLRVWDVRHAWSGEDAVSTALVNQAASMLKVDIVVNRNSRTGAVGVYRQAWATDKVDLFKLNELPGVKFAHKNGFYAIITNDIPDVDLAILIAAATR